jgi:hypothetical protein
MGMKEGGMVEKFMLPPMHVSKFKYSSMRSAYSIHQ